MDKSRNRSLITKLPLIKSLIYSGPAFALAVVGIPIYVYLPKFYSDTVGINIAAMGILLFALRIFDAIIDPIVGYISDITKTRFGRRRPFIAIGSLFLALSLFLLFNPPYTSPGLETIWFGVTLFCLFLFWTVVTVPYEALGPELTFDYHERTKLFGMRDGMLLVGTLTAAASPAAISYFFELTPAAEGERYKFFLLSVIYAPLLVILSWVCFLGLSETSLEQENKLTGRPKLNAEEIRSVFNNKPFLVLIVSYTVAAFGANLPATLILYYVEYVLHSQRAELFLVIYFIVGILCLPGWVAIAKRVGKKASWLGAMAVNTVAFFFVFFLGEGDELLYATLVALSGVGFGATVAIPSSMQADVIDYDELLTGERREGLYVGFWLVTRKLAAALGVGLGLLILGYAGYRPNMPQTTDVTFALKTLYALVPCVCNALGFLIALRYPISRSIHEEIRYAIACKQWGEAYSDPLGRKTNDSVS